MESETQEIFAAAVGNVRDDVIYSLALALALALGTGRPPNGRRTERRRTLPVMKGPPCRRRGSARPDRTSRERSAGQAPPGFLDRRA